MTKRALPQEEQMVEDTPSKRCKMSLPLEPFSPPPSSVASSIKSPLNRSLQSPSSAVIPVKGFITSYGVAVLQHGRTMHIWSTVQKSAVAVVLEGPVSARSGLTQQNLVGVFDLRNHYSQLSHTTTDVLDESQPHHISVIAVTPEGYVRYWPWINLTDGDCGKYLEYTMRKKELYEVGEGEHFTRYFVDEVEQSIYLCSADASQVAKLQTHPTSATVEASIVYDASIELDKSKSFLSSLFSWGSSASKEIVREETRSVVLTKHFAAKKKSVLVLTDKTLKKLDNVSKTLLWQFPIKEKVKEILTEDRGKDQRVWILDMTCSDSGELSPHLFVLVAATPCGPHPNGTIPQVLYYVFEFQVDDSTAEIHDLHHIHYTHDYNEYLKNEFVQKSKIHFSLCGDTPVVFILWKDRYSYLLKHTDDTWLIPNQTIPTLDLEEISGAGIFRQYKGSPLCILTPKAGVSMAKVVAQDSKAPAVAFQPIEKGIREARETSVDEFIRLLKEFADGDAAQVRRPEFYVSPSTLINVSHAIIDARSSTTDWAKQHNQLDLQPALMVTHLLEQKWKRYDVFLRMLMFSDTPSSPKLWDTLNQDQQQVVLQNGESLKISLALKRSQEPLPFAKNNDRLVTAIKRACAKRGLSEDMCNQEQFYMITSKVFAVFESLLQLERETEKREYADIACTNAAFSAIVTGVQEHSEYLNYIHRLLVSYTMSTRLVDEICPLIYEQIETTFDFLQRGFADEKEEQVLLKQVVILADFYLYVLNEHGDDNLKKVIAERRRRIIELFTSRALSMRLGETATKSASSSAILIAEKYHDYSMLVQLCHKFFDAEQQKEKLQQYLVRFRDTAFPTILFQHFVTTGQYNAILSKESPWVEEYKDEIGQVIQGRPVFEWMHAVQHNNIVGALQPLSLLARDTKINLSNKTTRASLLKLAAYCAEQENVQSIPSPQDYFNDANQILLDIDDKTKHP